MTLTKCNENSFSNQSFLPIIWQNLNKSATNKVNRSIFILLRLAPLFNIILQEILKRGLRKKLVPVYQSKNGLTLSYFILDIPELKVEARSIAFQ